MLIALDTTSVNKNEKTGHGYYVDGLLSELDKITKIEVKRLQPDKEGDFNTLRRFFWDQIIMPWQARRSKADLLHLTAFSVPFFYPGKKLVTVHDLALLKFPENLKGFSGWFLGKLVPITFKRADHIIAVSESTRDDLVKILHIPRHKISVVLEAVSSFYQPSDKNEEEIVLSSFGLNKHKYFLFVGTLEPRKNLPFLIRAVAPVLKNHPEHKLVIAGKPGWQYEEIYEEIKRQGLALDDHWVDVKYKISNTKGQISNVKMVGYITDEEKRGLYSSALAFCYPSKYEGFGLPLLEAMACGCPVITADNSSLPEVAGQAGVVLPLKEDAWRKTLNDFTIKPELHRRYSKLGQQRAKEFTWEKVAAETAKVYDEMLKK